jgi:hypothetical protein
MLNRLGFRRLARAFRHQQSGNGHLPARPALPPSSAPPHPATILDCYFKSAPSLQNAIDIFKGEWTSKFPPPHDGLSAGAMPIFQDGRLIWAIQQLGGVYDKNILELGPLEGAHSYILERFGAASVTAVEANSRAYLKCLITKEIFNLARTRLLCGDFVEYLAQTDRRFDLIVASGVLYHMTNPLRLLELLATHTDRLYLWTHYFDQAIIAAKPYLQTRFRSQVDVQIRGVTVTEYRQDYLHSLQVAGYTGGSHEFSTWLSREGILAVLRELGFSHFEFAYEMPDHPHGPCFSLIAVRR